MKHLGVVLHSDMYVSPFVERVLSACEATFVIWLGQNKPSQRVSLRFPEIKQYMYGDYGLVNFVQCSEKKVPLIFFDVFLIPTLNCMSKYKALNFSYVFIQHGVFGELTREFRVKGITLSWCISSIKHAIRFLNLHGWSWGNICILINVFQKGAWSARKMLRRYIVPFDTSIFWVEHDAKILSNEFPSIINNIKICESPDNNRINLEYAEDGLVLLITQPLAEDNIIKKKKYEIFLDNMQCKYKNNLLIIRHPRLSVRPDAGILLSEVHGKTLKVSKVVGHYSSLLLSVPKGVPIDIETFDIETIKVSAEEILQRIKEDNRKNELFDEVIRELKK